MIEIRKLQKSDNRDNFSSGNIEIDRFFKKFAGQNQFKHRIGVTYIAKDLEKQKIVGYITISIGSLKIEGLKYKDFKKFPKYPLPILRIARLGVDKVYQNRGIGKKLLKYIFYLALELEEKFGCIGIFVDAKEDAIDFYKKFGFEIIPVVAGNLPTRPKQTIMYLSLETIHKAIAYLQDLH